jgi:hypothetical protein
MTILPQRMHVTSSTLSSTPFLKMYNGMNSIHEKDWEKASSILMNLVYRP